MSDTSTTAVEQMAVLMEREIRRITKIDNLKSNEAEMLRDLAKERDAARAENERLTKERDNLSKLEQSHREQANEQFHRANKAIAERDEARASLRHMEGFDRCTCGPCAIHGVTTLADAERDMRQRAADACAGIEVDRWDKWKDGSDMLDQGASDGAGECVTAILALPLKHADREEGA